jgi:hypothetical protein
VFKGHRWVPEENGYSINNIINEKIYDEYLKGKSYEDIIQNFSNSTFKGEYERIINMVDTKMGIILNEKSDAVAEGVGALGTGTSNNNTSLTPTNGSPQSVRGLSSDERSYNKETTSGIVDKKSILFFEGITRDSSTHIGDEIKKDQKGSYLDDKGGSKNKTRKTIKKQKKNRKTKSKRRYIRKTIKRFTKFKSSSSSNKKTRKV